METFLKNNRTQIIGYGLWLVYSVLAFVSLNALIALLTRLFTYFWVGGDIPKLFLFLRQFSILPVGIALLILVRYGYEVVSKHAADRPERIWHFYTTFLALEFAILYLAAKI